MSVQKSQTKLLVQDYVGWRLARAGHPQWHRSNKTDLERNSTVKLFAAMRLMALKFETVYRQQHIELTVFNCKDTFTAIVCQLFELDASVASEESNKYICCNWGRIVGLFAFTGFMAIELFDKKSANLIFSITGLLVDFLNNDKRLFGWIESNGGWVNELKTFLTV